MFASVRTSFIGSTAVWTDGSVDGSLPREELAYLSAPAWRR